MAKKETKSISTAEANTPAQEQAPIGLSLNDLVTVVQVIQLSSQRGAFRAEELSDVGALYNKLVTFLQASGALAKPEDAAKQENQNA
jgi:hypothetical protein